MLDEKYFINNKMLLNFRKTPKKILQRKNNVAKMCIAYIYLYIYIHTYIHIYLLTYSTEQSPS